MVAESKLLKSSSAITPESNKLPATRQPGFCVGLGCVASITCLASNLNPPGKGSKQQAPSPESNPLLRQTSYKFWTTGFPSSYRFAATEPWQGRCSGCKVDAVKTSRSTTRLLECSPILPTPGVTTMCGSKNMSTLALVFGGHVKTCW